MPRLTPTMATTDILLPTGFLMPMATTPTHSDTTTARGPLMLSPPPMLMLMPTSATMATVMDTLMPMATPTPSDTTSARGPLMLSLLLTLMLTPTLATTATPLSLA